MKKTAVKSVSSSWVQLGVILDARATGRPVDIERLLLDTARVASADSRLFVLAVTWLTRYGDYVAKHRLSQLTRDEMEVQHQPALGLLLELAREHGPSNGWRFNKAIEACESAGPAKPLFDVEGKHALPLRMTEERASPISRKWGRWMSEFKAIDAIRPPKWIATHNPELFVRALAGGDLMASVWAECNAGQGFIESEAELARRCGASRIGVRVALRRLKMAGLIDTEIRGLTKYVMVQAPQNESKMLG